MYRNFSQNQYIIISAYSIKIHKEKLNNIFMKVFYLYFYIGILMKAMTLRYAMPLLNIKHNIKWRSCSSRLVVPNSLAISSL